MQGFKNESGYSLIEVVIVMVILSVISVMVVTPMIETGKGWRQIGSRKNVMQLARLGMDKMVRILRNTQRLAANTPNISVNSTASCLSFTTGDDRNYTFNLNGSVLEECSTCDCGAVVAPDNLVVNVSVFTVTCYDGANVAVACNTVAPVRRVLLRLSVTENGESATLDSEVTLRNLQGV
ncbi:MAG: PilW family protein [Nitrospiria bacterium]